MTTGEARRLDEDARREKNWKRWGPYLSERQWATVREDYSPDGNLWESFPYEHSLARAYRWGEDGLLGIIDRECRLCFALAMWNGKDPHLKERLSSASPIRKATTPRTSKKFTSTSTPLPPSLTARLS